MVAPFVTPASEHLSLAEMYHENSKLHVSDSATYRAVQLVNTSPEIRRVIARPFSTYRGFPAVDLPSTVSPTARAFEQVLLGRRSVRSFSGAPIGLDALGTLLLLGDGICRKVRDADGTEWSLRTAPSGGALFPIEVFCVALKIEGLQAGVYFYNALHHRLEQIGLGDHGDLLAEATYLRDAVGQSAACIVLSAVMPRTTFKYGERAYRFALLEAGHIAQNLLLATEAQGLGAVAVGGFIDDKINALVGVDGCEEIVVYLVLVGHV